MVRFLLSAIAVLMLGIVRAGALPDDGPPINITSPDTATTFAYGKVKSHTLLWDKKQKMLIADIVFVDSVDSTGQSPQDEHNFRLPGVTFDEAKGVFYATTAAGQQIPVAKIEKQLFVKNIVVLPNANIQVRHPKGDVTVCLVAISPNDPALKQDPTAANPDGTHTVNLQDLLN